MNIPKNLEVAEVLRQKKLFKSELNDINTKHWKDIHYKEWQCILKGLEYIPIKKVNPRHNQHNKVKVMRLNDGYIFESVGDCKMQEGIHGVLMRKLLKEETKYKKVIK